jgi:hypothetical protein
MRLILLWVPIIIIHSNLRTILSFSIMRKNFNDSSGVSGCLNFNLSANKENCLNLREVYSPLVEKIQEYENMSDQKTRQRQKDMYLSRYNLDFKLPMKNSSETNNLIKNPKCTCEHCKESRIYFNPHKTLDLSCDPALRKSANKNASKTDSPNSLINCVKNLKLEGKLEETRSVALSSNIHSKRKLKKNEPKHNSPCKVSVHSIGTSVKKSCLYESDIKNFKPTVFKPTEPRRPKLNKKMPHQKTTNKIKENNNVIKTIVSEQSSSSSLNENIETGESKTTTNSAYSVKDHLFDVNKFNRINHDYDIENYFCKNNKTLNVERNPYENCEKIKTKLPLKSHYSTQAKKKFLDNGEKNIRHMKKAYMVEDLNSITNVYNHKTRDACQNETNVCRHISLVCDKCVENINLKNFKLYRCDLINDVLR